MINRSIILLGAVAVLSACSPPSTQGTGGAASPTAGAASTSASTDAGPQTAGAASQSASAPAGADAAITAWARGQEHDALIEPVNILYGDFTGDGAPDAIAFVYSDYGGSGADLTVALFRNQSGRMTFLRRVDEVGGMEPRDAHFSNGRIVLTTTTPRPGDAHCCPTGSHVWTINTN